MTRSITVPVDWYRQSLRSLGPASVMAAQMGLSLKLISIVPSEDLVAVREGDLRGVLHEHDLDAELAVLPDTSPANRLVEYARVNAGDLMCMSTHARGAVTEAVMGSVAFRVLRESGRPLVMVGPDQAPDWGPRVQTLLVCLDGSSFAESILEPTAALAVELGARISLVQVFDTATDRPPPGQDSAEWVYLRRMAGALERDHGIQADWETLHGKDPGRALVDYAGQTPGSLLAMTTHGRTGASRALMGSVAQRACRHSPVPLLLHCPEGAAA